MIDFGPLLAQGAQTNALLAEAVALLAARPVREESVQNDHFEQIEQRDRGHHQRGGGNKPSRKLLATMKWIEDHDPDLKASIREIADGAGVSVGTAQAARKRSDELVKK